MCIYVEGAGSDLFLSSGQIWYKKINRIRIRHKKKWAGPDLVKKIWAPGSVKKNGPNPDLWLPSSRWWAESRGTPGNAGRIHIQAKKNVYIYIFAQIRKGKKTIHTFCWRNIRQEKIRCLRNSKASNNIFLFHCHLTWPRGLTIDYNIL